MLLVLQSCEVESGVYHTLHPDFLSLKPANQYNKLFANGNGDTVSLYLSSNESSIGRSDDSQRIGSIGNGNTRYELRSYTLSCDTPFVNINYHFAAHNSRNDFGDPYSRLRLTITDSVGTSENLLFWIYRNDSIFMSNHATNYYDTLSIIGQSFTQVFQPQEGLPDDNLLYYYNYSQGIVGFQTRAGVVYELVN